MNSTSFFYATPTSGATKSWAWKKSSPLADARAYHGAQIDYNVRAERMGWLPSAPSSRPTPAGGQGRCCGGHGREGLRRQVAQDGSLTMSCEDPDHPDNWPRNMFVWRSNILGSSGKGMSTSSSTCWAPRTACRAKTQRRSQARRSAVARQCA